MLHNDGEFPSEPRRSGVAQMTADRLPPLIVRLLMSADWREAFRLVWAETFKVPATDMGVTAPQVDIIMNEPPSWSERRAICLRMGRRCAEDDLSELACAWAALAVDPAWPKDDEPARERAKMFLPVNLALGDAIAEDCSLPDDIAFAHTVMGWRFMEAFGVAGPDQDPIVVGQAAGAETDVNKDELFRWALQWWQG